MRAKAVLLFVILLFSSTYGSDVFNSKDFAKGLISSSILHVKDWQKQAEDGKSVLGLERTLGSLWQNPITCNVCHATAGLGNWILSQKLLYHSAEELIAYACSFALDYGVCKGAVVEMGDVLIPQLTSMIFTAEYSCSRIYGFCSSPTYYTMNAQSYVNRLIADKPDFIKNNDFIDKLYAEVKADKKPRETVKILHMSDLHLDLEYTVGNNKNCGLPLCCMSTNGPAQKPEDAAGQFGEYECDLPPQTLESMFHYVRDMDEADKPDLIIWTGDNVAHDIWNQTAHKNTEATIVITEFIKSHWPEMPVFVSPGNHEFYPVNVEEFTSDNQPILERLAQHWTEWIDGDDLEQFKKYGYYSIPLKTISECFSHIKIITLNTQVSNDLNFALLTTMNDPADHLAWLEEELRLIEKNNEVAYIIGHIPPNEALHEWGIRYKALIERFQHVIRYQGFGHDHEENMFVARGAYDFKPFGSFHLAGSVTTFTGKNPSFRIIEADLETMLPIKFHTHFLNITKANKEGVPTWERRYEFTELYGLEDLSPTSLSKLPEMFFKDPKLAVTWLKNRYGQGGSDSDNIHSCDTNCLFNLECDILSAETNLKRDCLGEYTHHPIQDIMNGDIGEYFFDPWVQKIGS